MFTKSGVRGSRAPHAIPFGLLGLVGVMTVGLAGSSPRTGSDPIVLAGYGSSGATSTLGGAEARASGTFRIAGSVGGLYPGLAKPLVLTVTNPQFFPIFVTSITTAVNGANAGCLASALSVSAFSGQLFVPALGSAKTSVLAKMSQSAPNACIGATFPLKYSGLGHK